MRILPYVAATLSALTLSLPSASAQESKASLTLNLPALTFRSTTVKSKPSGGSETTVKVAETDSADRKEAYVQFGYGNFSVYYNPFESRTLVSPSYLVNPMVELGLDIGVDSEKTDKPDLTNSTSTLGLFGWVYPTFGTVHSEFGLAFRSIATKGESADATTGAVTKSESTASVSKLIANVLVPFAKNFHYVGGIWFEQRTDDLKKPAKVKTTHGTFGINLATLRLTVD